MNLTSRIKLDLPSAVSDEELSDALWKIASSRLIDPDQAREIIGQIAAKVLSGHPLNDDLRDWLGWSLMAISRGIDPRTALCLQKRGAPAKVSWEQIFPFVHDRVVSGEAWTLVCKKAADDLSEKMGSNIDEKTVRLIYRETLKSWYDLWIVADPVWERKRPTVEELRSFRCFTLKSIKQMEAARKNMARIRK